MKPTRRQLIFIAAIAIAVFFVIVLSFRQSPTSSPLQQVSLTPIPPNDSYNNAQQSLLPTNAPLMKKEEAVGSLLQYVPYNGTYCTFDYDVDEGKYILILKQETEAQGRNECDAWLKTHGVGELSWIRNFRQIVITPGV